MQVPSSMRRPGFWELIRLFLKDRGASNEFANALADRAVAQLPSNPAGRTLLDLGCGPGFYSQALSRAGAHVISVEYDHRELLKSPMTIERPLVADGRRLPMPDAVFDCVVCSNVLEHTPEPFAIINEIVRVTRPGGWAYISWTNWLSPWGGHAVAPLHYLGAERSVRVWTKVFGKPSGKNIPFAGVWPTYIGATIRFARSHPDIDVLTAYPRYWPRLKLIMRVPGLREIASWNCVILVSRRELTPKQSSLTDSSHRDLVVSHRMSKVDGSSHGCD